ncbi:MAG TPA: nucleotidyltransferase family protein, partial [Abditibacteriaceae bacterium]|nr:nucleotidyltransferase family protein [Abditibacteriaceae bacterium]
AAEEQDLPLTISLNLTRTVDDDLTALVEPFEKFRRLQMRFYDVQPVGRARDMEGTLRQEISGFCTACCVPTVTDDGRVTACNGPAYFSAPSSPLIVGSLRENTFAELVEKHRSDPILDTIRTFGPSRLRRELQQTPGFEDFPFHESYSGMCDLCLHLTSQPQAMTALYERLSQSRPTAERIAAQYVMNAARHGDGELNRDYVNSLGACRVFLRAALEPARDWADEAERTLGRADLDWSHQALHLMRCGLSLPLQNALGETALSRWAPPFFIERLRRQALNDTFRRVTQRQALEQIAAAIREVGTRGVLLKGTAMMAIDDELAASGIEYSKRVTNRSCSDVDLYIPRGQAISVREKLLQRGFKDVETAGEDMTAWHQLPQMVYRGALVEIHQELQPDFCGLPEREMLRHARSLQSDALQGLQTLDAEGMLLYSAVHLSKHLFAHGLKTAWDFVWIMDRFPSLDWNRVANLARRTGMNRGFWVPVCVLCRELAIPFPASFLKRAPRDRRQRKMETLAHRHLFGTTSFVFEDNPWICQALYAMLADSWRHRVRLGFRLVFGKESRRLRHERQKNDPSYGHSHLQKLRGALVKWRQLR